MVSALSSRIASALANRTPITAPYAVSAFRQLINTTSNSSNDNVSQSSDIGSKSTRRSDGQTFSKTPITARLSFSEQQRMYSTYSRNSTVVPDFSAYKKENTGEDASRAFSYFMVGTTGLATAVTAKATVYDFLTNLSASADVLALAKVEVDLANIPEGKNVVVKWRGKPVFIRHRTASEISEANSVNVADLRDPQTDGERVKQPEWMIMLGICTHLGCVPIGEAGDYGGWYCPCHGSHYDISGRIRKGPAPLNLEIPEYTIEGDSLVIG